MNPNLNFFMKGNQPTQGGLPSGDSTAKRLLFVGGGAVALLFVFILVIAMFSSSGGGSASLLTIAQRQGNLANMAELTLQHTDSQAVKNVAISAQFTAKSSQKELTTAAGLLGVSFSEKDLELGVDPAIQGELETAKAAGLLNQTALEALTAGVKAYQEALAAGFEQTSNEEVKRVISEQYEAADLLATQVANTKP